MNDDPISCNIVATYFDDTAVNGTAGNILIGTGFHGFIRKVKIYDWPKNEDSMKLMYKVAPACYKFHHTQTD